MERIPSPARIFDALTAYQRTAAIKAAIELDLFSAIGSSGATAAQLADQRGVSERGVRSLCGHLVVDGLLSKASDGLYGLDPDAALFLDRTSPAYIGSAAAFLTSPTIVTAFERLTEAVRRGGTALGPEGSLEPEHPMWVEFARAMGPLARVIAEVLAAALGGSGPIRGSVLDIAAGHGQ